MGVRLLPWGLAWMCCAGCGPAVDRGAPQGGATTTGASATGTTASPTTTGGTTGGTTGSAPEGAVVVAQGPYVGQVSALLAAGHPAVVYAWHADAVDTPTTVRFARAAAPDGGPDWETVDLGAPGLMVSVRSALVDGRPAVACPYEELVTEERGIAYWIAADPDGLGEWSRNTVPSSAGPYASTFDLGVVGGRPTLCRGVYDLRVAQPDAADGATGTWTWTSVPMPSELADTDFDDCAVVDLGGKVGVLFSASAAGDAGIFGLHLATASTTDITGTWTVRRILAGAPTHAPSPIAAGRRDGNLDVLFVDNADATLRTVTAADDVGAPPWLEGPSLAGTPVSAIALSADLPAPVAAYAGAHPADALYGVFARVSSGDGWSAPVPVDLASNADEALTTRSTSVVALADDLGVGVAYDVQDSASEERQVRFARLP